MEVHFSFFIFFSDRFVAGRFPAKLTGRFNWPVDLPFKSSPGYRSYKVFPIIKFSLRTFGSKKYHVFKIWFVL
ncbi:hypothetical protein BpHYR1_052731 [Brachionus plicatilis]|uniref:Uncharacterized protein n=1 Tax=Brachionus plicatilis TaxID=10195 RepID=A0A3M7SJX6_BRAPC|nr:hypothetical protein BpHYR1_052731 [Brachionus plicatilis]